MDEREKRLLSALVLMVQQYLEDRGGGLMDVVRSGRIFGQWTKAGNQFRNAQ